MADQHPPNSTPDPFESQIRAAARSLIARHAGAARELPEELSERIAGTSHEDQAFPDDDPDEVSVTFGPHRGRRFGRLAIGVAAAAAMIAIVVLLVNRDDEAMLVTIDPAREVPEPAPTATLLVTMGTDRGDGQPEGATAVLFDAHSLERLGEIRLPAPFFKGGLGGTTLDAVSLVEGELEFLYSTYTDVIDIAPHGTVAEATEMPAALWSEGSLTADRLSYLMQLGPDGTLLTAERGRRAGSTNTRAGGLSGFNTVIDDRWTITTGRRGDTRSFTWDGGPMPLEDTQLFTPDGTAVVNLHGLARDGTGSMEVTTLALGQSCAVCSADGRTFDLRPVELGLGVLDAGFLDDTTIWFEWADRAPPDDANPFAADHYGREWGLGTLDLLSGDTAAVGWPVAVDTPDSTHRVISSVGDGTLLLQQTAYPRDDGTEVEKLAALRRWDGSEWSTVELPAAPDGLAYEDVFVLPGVPESLGDPGGGNDHRWCDRDLEGPVPEVAELGQRVLDVSGSERQVSEIDGLGEIVETMTPDHGMALPELWLGDCTIAVQLSDYDWDRLLLRFARTGDGRFALTGTDRWSHGPA